VAPGRVTHDDRSDTMASEQAAKPIIVFDVNETLLDIEIL